MAERGNQPTPVSLDVEAQLAATTPPQTNQPDAVRFEGIAVSPGTYGAEDGIEIEITADHLDAIAARLEDVQIRDLHEDRIRATVGAVRSTRVLDEAVAFRGEIGIEPHATIVRRFPETVAFSVGFRFAREELDLEDGTARLPEGFGIDHLALVGQGQDPQARLTRLLNRAHEGATTQQDGITVDEDTAADLRRQRDDALEAEQRAMDDLEETRSRLENKDETIEQLEAELGEAREAVETAETEAERARLELEQARAHFADSILKLELRAGRDVDLTERREQLLDMDLGELDGLRLELADEAAENEERGQSPASKPTGGQGQDSGQDDPDGVELDLDELSTRDTIRLGLMREAI